MAFLFDWWNGSGQDPDCQLDRAPRLFIAERHGCSEMASSSEYVPPKVWTWNKPNGGRFANINRPTAGPNARQGSAGRPASSTALFARHTERRESYGHVGGTPGPRA